jgi:hypothetical protein
MESDLTVQQLPTLIKEWMTTEDEVNTLNAALREKKKRAKLVRDMIMKIMKGNNVGRLNISTGAVTTRVKKSKQAFTKKYLNETLTSLFNGDVAMAAKCAAFLEENRGTKHTENLTLDPL